MSHRALCTPRTVSGGGGNSCVCVHLSACATSPRSPSFVYLRSATNQSTTGRQHGHPDSQAGEMRSRLPGSFLDDLNEHGCAQRQPKASTGQHAAMAFTLESMEPPTPSSKRS